MIGLLRNNYYAMQDNIKFSLLMSLFLAVIPVFTVNSLYTVSILGMQILIFIVNIGTSLQQDETSKWNRWELTLPVTRSTIIRAKYLSFILLIVLGVSTTFITLLLLSLIGKPLEAQMLIQGYTFGLSLAIPVAAFTYPLILKWGAGKSEIMIFVSCGLSFGIRTIVLILLNFISDSTVNFNDTSVGIITTLISLLLLVVSYLLSTRIQQNKEY